MSRARKLTSFSAFVTPTNVTSFVSSVRKSTCSLPPRRRISHAAVTMGTSMPEIPEVSLPEPPVPKEEMDSTIGESTGVVTVDVDVSPETGEPWIKNLLSTRSALPNGHPLESLRARADAILPSLSLPSRKDEPWRFTDLRSLYKASFTIPPQVEVFPDTLQQVLPDAPDITLVFVDGVLSKDLSLLKTDTVSQWESQGGFVGSIADYPGDHAVLIDAWNRQELSPNSDSGLFPIVGNAIAKDAAVIDVPAEMSRATVAWVSLTTGGVDASVTTAVAPRLAVIARHACNLQLLELHLTLPSISGVALALPATATIVHENANVTHYVVNDIDEKSFMISTSHATVQKGGSYKIHAVGIGGKLGRFTKGVDLEGDGAAALLYSSLLADGYRIQDLHSRICHNSTHTKSEQLQKNIATDHGRTIFNGKIIVTNQGAGTDSTQLSRSLILSERATVDAIPVLEIANDDVKCSHGATVSDLGDDELFYLRSRGLCHRDAQSLLVLGFVLEAIGDCPFPALIARLRQRVTYISEVSKERELAGISFTSV